jgi:hypothetical protein
MKSRSAAVFFLSCLVNSCATRPVPENVTRINTWNIVQNIRCEVRQAIREFVISYLANEGDAPEIAARLESGALTFATFTEKSSTMIDKIADEVIKRYENAAIAYGFSFDMTSSNDLASGGDFIGNFKAGPLTVNIGSTHKYERQNLRKFDLVDSFGFLAASPIMVDVCDSRQSLPANGMYPISGSLGMEEMVGTFLNLNQSGNLTGVGGTPRLSDTLTFTTEVSGKIDATLEPISKGAAITIKKVSLNGGGGRKDIHTLTIVMTLPPDDTQPDTIFLQRTRAELERVKTENRQLEDDKLRKKLVDVITE